MERETLLKYLELALMNLNSQKSFRFNIECELIRLMNLYSEEEINEKIKNITYHLKN
ncbi:hypothetical protein [Vagococcus penaei]|uniref:hypothetical protein n=1 Tax=Vagococcus penaei TaxID=633807 RepID=UPI0014712E23|nr:hypothetical protein [Vagococcus penaei]